MPTPSVPREFIIGQIANAQIEQEPFPHIILDRLVPDDYYSALLAQLPPTTHYLKADYPGTGYGKRRGVAGRAVLGTRFEGMLAELGEFVSSDEFCRVLFKKFQDIIPSEKHQYFAGAAADFRSVYSLYLDGEGYEIPPHNDKPEKIITFLWYLTSDDSLARFGTMLCKPKRDGSERGPIARMAKMPLDILHALTRGRPSEAWRRLARTSYAFEAGFGDARNWRPWRRFEVAKTAQALPNHFLAFAPHAHSWHAVRMEVPPGVEGRHTLRGFIRSGSNANDYVTERG